LCISLSKEKEIIDWSFHLTNVKCMAIIEKKYMEALNKRKSKLTTKILQPYEKYEEQIKFIISIAKEFRNNQLKKGKYEIAKEINKIQLGKGWVEHLKWSPDGKHLAIAFSRDVYVFNSLGDKIWHSEKHPSTVSALAWVNNNELATSCYGQVAFFDIENNKVNQRLEWQGSLVSMVISPSGDIVACGSQDNSVHFWRRTTGHDAEMTGYPSKPSNLSFDQSGTLLATGGSERVTVWSFEGNGPEGSIPGELGHHTEPVTSLSFSHKGKLIASGSRDGSVVVSFLQSNGHGNPVGAAFAGDYVSKIAWKPDDCALAAVCSKGSIHVWPFKPR